MCCKKSFVSDDRIELRKNRNGDKRGDRMLQILFFVNFDASIDFLLSVYEKGHFRGTIRERGYA